MEHQEALLRRLEGLAAHADALRRGGRGEPVEDEIAGRQARGAGWARLEACFRWRAVRAYLEGRGVAPDDPRTARVRALLRGGALPPPAYDAASGRVTALGVEGL